MPWWMWLLLILVLLSLIVLIVLLLLWLGRRKEVASEPMRADVVPADTSVAPTDMEPPAEPTTIAAVEPEEAAQEAVTQTEEAAAEAEETAAGVEDTAQEAAQETGAEITEAAAETGQVAEQAAQEIIEPMASRVEQAIPIEPPPPDDLKIIEGIGPKISSVFQAAGITTLAQLGATEVDELKRILKEANIRLGYPDTWPEQASLAAKGKWDELTALQDSLKGGRRV